jgi:predicted transcriptional regulator with HTH domain
LKEYSFCCKLRINCCGINNRTSHIGNKKAPCYFPSPLEGEGLVLGSAERIGWGGNYFIRNIERPLEMSILLGTKLRKNLLVFSFKHPDESFYVRELSGLIRQDPGNLSRELRKLEEEGIYSSTTRGNVKFYSLNKSYPLFQEVKKIVLNSVDGGKKAKAAPTVKNPIRSKNRR